MNVLNVQQLRVSFARASVLEDVSFELKRGQMLTLLGQNGAGKSTLIRACLNLLKFSGAVLWDGRAVGSMHRRALAQIAAYLPQNPSVLPGQRVIDVIRAGRWPYAGALGIETAQDDQVVHRISTMLGLDDVLHKPIERLSGGQRQRAIVGRALAQEPRVLLLDEPATFLDLHHQIALLKLLRELCDQHQLSVLIASHDVNMPADFSDLVLILKQGRVLGLGDPSQVVRANVLSRAFDLKMTELRDGKGRYLVVPDTGT